MTKYNYDNLPCSQPYLKYMKCVKGHQAQKRLDKQVDPETIPPRAPNGMKLKRYTITKQQEWTKVSLVSAAGLQPTEVYNENLMVAFIMNFSRV